VEFPEKKSSFFSIFRRKEKWGIFRKQPSGDWDVENFSLNKNLSAFSVVGTVRKSAECP
jgi:hypothetical protein